MKARGRESMQLILNTKLIVAEILQVNFFTDIFQASLTKCRNWKRYYSEIVVVYLYVSLL